MDKLKNEKRFTLGMLKRASGILGEGMPFSQLMSLEKVVRQLKHTFWAQRQSIGLKRCKTIANTSSSISDHLLPMPLLAPSSLSFTVEVYLSHGMTKSNFISTFIEVNKINELLIFQLARCELKSLLTLTYSKHRF